MGGRGLFRSSAMTTAGTTAILAVVAVGGMILWQSRLKGGIKKKSRSNNGKKKTKSLLENGGGASTSSLSSSSSSTTTTTKAGGGVVSSSGGSSIIDGTSRRRNICSPRTITIVHSASSSTTTGGTSTTGGSSSKELARRLGRNLSSLYSTTTLCGLEEEEDSSSDDGQEEKKQDLPVVGEKKKKKSTSSSYQVQIISVNAVESWWDEFLDGPKMSSSASLEEEPPILLFIGMPTSSTTTQQQPPLLLEQLHKLATDWRVEKRPLQSKKLHVAVFGGMTAAAGEEEQQLRLDNILVEKLGAQRLCDTANVQEEEEDAAFEKWMENGILPSMKKFVEQKQQQEEEGDGSTFIMDGGGLMGVVGGEEEPTVTDMEDLGNDGGKTCGTSTSRALPDYGKTPVQVGKIRLSKSASKSKSASSKNKSKKITKFRRKDLDGQTLINQTLKEMEVDEDFQDTERRLKQLGQKGMSMEERKQRRRALDKLGVPEFRKYIKQKFIEEEYPKEERNPPGKKKCGGPTRGPTEVLQLNIGLYCNQACAHCHVESSPRRKEMMAMEIAKQCIILLQNSPEINTLDLTGGAPELNTSFRYLVKECRTVRPDVDIIDRCNLTVLHEPGQSDLVKFLKDHQVHIIASLPCYSAKNVNQQRGSGVFERSVSALLMLNEVGYGSPNHPELILDLVYNPLGAFLPPPQVKLELQYKKELDEHFGIVFNSLYTMTNMPIKRFADFLQKRGELEAYMDLLVRNFNLDTVKTLMCTNTISVGYDGKIFDCDFNQQLGLGVGSKAIHDGGLSVFDITSMSELKSKAIRTDNHCFGCTAGMGSS